MNGNITYIRVLPTTSESHKDKSEWGSAWLILCLWDGPMDCQIPDWSLFLSFSVRVFLEELSIWVAGQRLPSSLWVSGHRRPIKGLSGTGGGGGLGRRSWHTSLLLSLAPGSGPFGCGWNPTPWPSWASVDYGGVTVTKYSWVSQLISGTICQKNDSKL